MNPRRRRKNHLRALPCAGHLASTVKVDAPQVYVDPCVECLVLALPGDTIVECDGGKDVTERD